MTPHEDTGDLQLISQNRYFTVYRAYKSSAGDTVILKKPNRQDWVANVARLTSECRLLNSLSLAGIPTAIEQRQDNTLVLSDIGDRTWRTEMTSQGGLDCEAFLAVALPLCEILDELHARHVIHKNINPDNVVIAGHPPRQTIGLVGFSMATDLERESTEFVHPLALEGALPYLSPEQTGRMNREVDYRSDFYSLGATFYEMLTGRHLFPAADALEWVHCHIALQPCPPHLLKPDIPLPISRVIMKLLAKNADHRYQSTAALIDDLHECRTQLENGGPFEDFTPGRNDHSTRLMTPDQLYGRSKQIQQLLAIFDEVCRGETALVLVKGYSGIGKTALVNEVQRPVIEKRGLFVTGKFDPLRRNTPYGSLLDAFKGLINQILGGTEEDLDRWRKKIIIALGVNARVVTDVLPELMLIIGEPALVPLLGTVETQNRFNLTLQNFIRVFAAADHPLVIFLDDLQWVDTATLGLIQWLVTDPHLRHLLVIGAYRDNEVDAQHPLEISRHSLCNAGARIEQIALEPLDEAETCELLADMLDTSACDIATLGQLVFRKTTGNPFFVTQLIHHLNDQKLLTWDTQARRWVWDLAEIEATGISDDVVVLLARKLKRLSDNSQDLIKLAACIGSYFTVDMLARVSGQPVSSITRILSDLTHTGLVLPVRDAHRVSYVIEQFPQLDAGYRFLHDRVQQAAYALNSDDERLQTHLLIARMTMQRTPASEFDESLYFITDQFNKATPLIHSDRERQLLLELNYKSGHKAGQSAAYGVAADYFACAIAMLAKQAWRNDYDFTLALYSEAAETAYYAQQEERARTIGKEVLHHARSLIDKIPIHELQVRIAASRNQIQKAIETCLDTLLALGIEIHEHFTHADINELFDTLPPLIESLGGIDALGHLPVMTDPHQKAALTILAAMVEPSYATSPILFQQVTFHMTKLCLTGYHPLSGVAFSSYGITLCARGDVERGAAFGELALSLTDRYQERRYLARLMHVVNCHIRPYWMHYGQTLSSLHQAISIGYENGDLNFAGHASMFFCTGSFFRGAALDTVAAHFADHSPRLASLHLDFDLEFIKPWHQLVDQLRKPAAYTGQLSGAIFDDNAFAQLEQAENKMLPFAAYSARAYMNYLFNEPDAALADVLKAEKYAAIMESLVHFHQHLFISALVWLAWGRKHAAHGEQSLRQANEHLAKLKVLARHAACNIENKIQFIEAEMAQTRGDLAAAMSCYDTAITLAQQAGFVHEEAMANERAADFYCALGRKRAAEGYLRETRDLYEGWGAIAKIRALDRRQLPKTQDQENKQPNTRREEDKLDQLSALKLSQLISREIDLSRLVPMLVQIMAANAGADRACLLLKRDGRLSIAAAYPASEDINDSRPEQWCYSTIHYTGRTQKSLVIANAQKHPISANDPCVRLRQTQSVLCIPILEQGRLLGVLYLENNHSTQVFSVERVEFLQAIAVQAAISLENSRLFADLLQAEKEQQQQRELLQAILNSLSEGVVVVDENSQLIQYNPAAKRIIGMEQQSAEQTHWAETYGIYYSNNHETLMDPASLPIIRAARGETFDDMEVFIRNRYRKEGATVLLSGGPLIGDDGSSRGGVVVFRDITERKQAEEHIHHLATHDVLTQLPNRMLFIEHMNKATQRARQDASQGALMFLDLDNFKEINDTLGHAIGDALLVEISRRLKRFAVLEHLVSRLGGDEFGIIIGPKHALIDIARLAQAIIDDVALPANVEGHHLSISVSIGITLFPTDGHDVGELIKNADLAMYSAKRMGRNTYSFYSQNMNAELQFRKQLGGELRSALAGDELEIYYQPQLDARRGTLVGLESLMRWPRARDNCSPAVFIPVAEQMGLIVSMGAWALKSVCNDLKSWLGELPSVPVAVNISALQLHQSDFIDNVRHLLSDTQIDPEVLEFEITESAAMLDIQAATHKMKQLRDLGIRLSMDDFGTGYSSLSYLKRLPFQKVKIDQSFVRDLEDDKESASIANAIINLGHCLGMKVVAEGVETAGQLRFLQESGCDVIQGFYYSKPLSGQDLRHWARKSRPRAVPAV